MLLQVAGLPGSALAAAADFHARIMPEVLAAAATTDSLVLCFAVGDHTQRGWRLAVVQQLAREQAPRRINAVAGGSTAAVAAAEQFLNAAPGITGQLFSLDDEGARAVLASLL